MLQNTSNSRRRSLPMQVSIMAVRPCERSTKHWKEMIILPVRRGEVRHQPTKLLQVLGRGLGQQHADVVFKAVDFDDARDIDIADAPVPDMFSRHACPARFAP